MKLKTSSPPSRPAGKSSTAGTAAKSEPPSKLAGTPPKATPAETVHPTPVQRAHVQAAKTRVPVPPKAPNAPPWLKYVKVIGVATAFAGVMTYFTAEWYEGKRSQPKTYEEKVHEAQEALAWERKKAEMEHASATALPPQKQPTGKSWFWWRNKSTAAPEPTPAPPKVEVPGPKIEPEAKKGGSWLPWKN